MPYIATGGTPDENDITVPNLPFFPTLSINLFREVMRVDQAVERPKLEKHLLTAVLHVNDELASWRMERIEDGDATLADVDQELYGEMPEYVHHYQMAVFSYAKAQLIENYRDYDTARSGHDRADEMETKVDDYYRDSKLHIRRIRGVPATTVELI